MLPMARLFLEHRDLYAVRGIFDGLMTDVTGAEGAVECAPALDVVETTAGLEIVMDLAGVTLESLTVVVAQQTLVISGEKRPLRCQHHAAAFHLVERAFGRFARGVRLSGPFDVGRAEATLRAGELRILLPRLEERRGREIRIDVRAD
jgi:HSP20 family protein